MKRKILPFIALAPLSLVFSACQTDPLEKGIVIWANSDELPVIERVIAEYNAEVPDKEKIKFRFSETFEGHTSPSFEKEDEELQNPALMLISGLSDIVDYSSSIHALASEMADSIKRSAVPKAVEMVSDKTGICGYPVSFSSGCFLYYHKDYFQEGDVASIESILQICQSNGKQFLFDLDNGYYASSIFLSPQVMGLDGVSYRYNEFEQVVYDLDWGSAKGAKAALDFSSLVAPYALDGTLIEGDNTSIATKAREGALISCVSGDWMYKTLVKCWGEDKVGAAKLPTFNVAFDGDSPIACQMASFIDGEAYIVMAKSSEKERAEAHRIAQLLTSGSAQSIRYDIRGVLPTDKAVQSDESFLRSLTVTGQALLEQERFGKVQSRAVEHSFWRPAENIGRAMMRGYDEQERKLSTLEDWQGYIKEEFEELVNPPEPPYAWAL